MGVDGMKELSSPGRWRITLLTENTASKANVLGEHGLAYWIENPEGKCVLFDTGQGKTLFSNADALGVDLKRADAIVLSHGHYDHAGGLERVLELVPETVPLFMHPDARQPKYSVAQGKAGRCISVAYMESRCAQANQGRLFDIGRPTEVVPGLWASGPIPRENDFEDTGGPFYLDQQGGEPDPLHDDQALYFRSAGGLVVVLGCAHSGVVNTLEHLRRVCPDSPVSAVLGGMHLLHAGEERLSRTIEVLSSLNLSLLAPNHCTGHVPIARLAVAFPDAFTPFHAGESLEFEAR